MRLPDAGASLAGQRIRLEPLDDAALAELAPVLWRPEVFAGGFGGGPAVLERHADFAAWFAGYRPAGDAARGYLVRLGADAVGTTSLYHADFTRESVKIGYTAYAPEAWGSAVNPDAKRALLAAAFDGGAHRVAFEIDAENARSRAAVAKLGAQFEGELREDRRRADGSWRSTAVYAILAADWPGVRAALDARILATR